MTSRIALVLALLSIVPPPVRAQSDPAIEITPFAGGTFFLGDGPNRFALERTEDDPLIVEGARFEDSWTAGVNVGLRMNELFALEALLAWVPTWLSGTNWSEPTDVYTYMYGVTGLLHVPVPGPLQPYWGIGFGAESYDYSGSIHSQTQWTTTFVAGMSWELGEGRSLRFQARDFLSPFDPDLPGATGGWENDLMVTAGMSWRIPLGPRKPLPSAPRRRGGGFLP